MEGMSDTEPERLIVGKNTAHYNYNIHQIEIEDHEGTPRTVYAYYYVVIEGKVTKSKIIRALENSKLDAEEEYDAAEIETNYNEAKSAIKLSNIAGMTYAQLDTYIDNNVTNLAEAKIYLKELSKVVLAMLKYMDVG